MQNSLTTGSVWKPVIRFSQPFILSYFLQTLYGLADLYIIGRFCMVESTTAVSIGSQVMHMLTVVIVGLSMGSVVVIGQAVGADDKKKASLSIGNTVFLFMTLSVVLTVLLHLLVNPIIAVMSTPEAAVPGTADYLRICFLGVPFITAYNIISSIFRGTGDSKSPMYFVAVACAVNIALDYLFIGYFGMDAAGAALGTTLSQTFSVVLALIVICRKKQFHLTKSDFRPQANMMKKILKIGLPVALQDGFIQVSFIVVTIFANLRGLQDAAAVGIVEKIVSLLFLVPSSMLQTVSTMAAQNIGAGKFDRVQKILKDCCLIAVAWGLFAVLLMHFESGAIIGRFTKDAVTVTMGRQYMESYVWDCVFAGIHFCFSGYFCAFGLSGLPFLYNGVSIVLIRIPFSYLAAKHFPDSLFPMGLVNSAGSLLSVAVCLTAYGILRKKKRIRPFGIKEKEEKNR